MSERGINRLPVVDEERKLIGIVTRADLVRAFVRSDAEIASEIRNDIIAAALGLDRQSLEVEVAEGEVTLAGELGSGVDPGELVGLVRRVPGVGVVDSKLTQRDDPAAVTASDPRR